MIKAIAKCDAENGDLDCFNTGCELALFRKAKILNHNEIPTDKAVFLPIPAKISNRHIAVTWENGCCPVLAPLSKNEKNHLLAVSFWKGHGWGWVSV